MDRMKDYRQLIKELPSTTLVCALGDFDPPTTAHELLVKTVNRLAEQKNTDHVIYASTKDSLIQEDKKEHYLKLMFPKTKFKSVNESKISNLLEELSKKYKKIVIVAGSEQVAGLKKLVKENTEIIAITEKNPDSNYAKMKQLAVKGLYEDFKKKLPSTIRELDGRRLMNDVRMGLGLDPVKDQLVLVKDKLREEYFRGEIFNESDIVESNGEQFTIVKRGSNHLLLKKESGKLVSKWIQDVKLVENHTTVSHNKDHKLLSHGADFNLKIGKEHHGKITALNHGDQHEFKCMDGNEWTVEKRGDKIHFTGHKQDTGISSNISFHVPHNHFTGEEEAESEDTKEIKSYSKMLLAKAHKDISSLTPEERTLLNMISKTNIATEVNEGVIQQNGSDKLDVSTSDTGAKKDDKEPKGKTKGFMTFYNYNMKEENINELSTDLLARYKTASHASAKAADASGNYAKGDKRFKGINKATTKQFDNDLKKHDQLKEEELEEAKKKAVCPECGEHKCECGEQRPGMGTEFNQPNDPFFKEDFTDKEIDEMVNSVTEEEIEDLYEEDELVLVYDDTGEEIPPLQEESKYDLMEVLSRTERMRGKIRLRKTSAKRGRSTKIALKRFSPPATINKRARRLAIKLMKKRMLRGRDYSKISVGEKERMEKVMSKRKDVIGRIAQKLVSRVRKVEKSRMSHGKVTKGSMPSVF